MCISSPRPSTLYVTVQYCVHDPTQVRAGKDAVHVLLDENIQGSPFYDAFYSLSDVRSQINNYVENVVRGSIPRMDLDDVFAAKDTLNEAIKNQIDERMKTFGYEIKQALIVNLMPDSKVATAMNDINAQARRREASSFQADAQKIVQVKAAEADAQSKYLSGMGFASQRKAIVQGLQSAVSEFANSVKGATSADVMDVLLVTQYFDMLRSWPVVVPEALSFFLTVLTVSAVYVMIFRNSCEPE